MGSGDFDGDGHDDILLRHAPNGHWIFYDMAGTRGALRRPGLTRNRLFRFEAIGDFNGDGRDDVMLRHAGNGEWIYYAMGRNHRGKLTRRFGMPRDLVDGLVATGDFDGDGDASPLLRQPETATSPSRWRLVIGRRGFTLERCCWGTSTAMAGATCSSPTMATMP